MTEKKIVQPVAFQFPPPKSIAEVRKVFGDPQEADLAKGMLSVDLEWHRNNIITVRNVCGTGLSIQLHRLIFSSFAHCLSEARKRCPDYKIDQLGGYSARRKMHNPKRDPSLHTWAIAFDVNWARNTLGKSGITDLPAPWIAAFTEQGWEWGGDWQNPDWMHFQFATGC